MPNIKYCRIRTVDSDESSEISPEKLAETIASGWALLFFWADWCPPCRMQQPIIEDLNKAYDGRLTIVRIDVDSCTGLYQAYQVSSIPALVLTKDGKEAWRHIGYISTTSLKENIDKKMA